MRAWTQMKRFRWWIVAAAIVGIVPVMGSAFTIFGGPVGYSGRLLDANGGAVADGNYTMTFRIFDATTGGTELFAQTVAAVPVVNGYFNTLLIADSTAGTSIDSVLTTGANRFLEVTVETETLAPRQVIAAVPWSVRSRLADLAVALQ